MHDRRELVLRLLQALGLAWIALALVFYLMPQVMIGRGVSMISLPLALLLMVGWRLAIHWVLGPSGDWRAHSDRWLGALRYRDSRVKPWVAPMPAFA